MKSFVQGFVVFCLLFVWVVAVPVFAEEPVSLKFGAMPVGSSWYIYAATYTTLLEKAFAEGSTFEVIPQGGGIANPLAVAQGKADVALANVATSKWAYDGIEMYEGKAAKNIRALAGGKRTGELASGSGVHGSHRGTQRIPDCHVPGLPRGSQPDGLLVGRSRQDLAVWTDVQGAVAGGVRERVSLLRGWRRVPSCLWAGPDRACPGRSRVAVEWDHPFIRRRRVMG